MCWRRRRRSKKWSNNWLTCRRIHVSLHSFFHCIHSLLHLGLVTWFSYTVVGIRWQLFVQEEHNISEVIQWAKDGLESAVPVAEDWHAKVCTRCECTDIGDIVMFETWVLQKSASSPSVANMCIMEFNRMLNGVNIWAQCWPGRLVMGWAKVGPKLGPRMRS